METKSFVGLDALQNYKSLWDQVATQLNGMGYGSKTTDKWIEVRFAATATTLQQIGTDYCHYYYKFELLAFSKWKSKVKVQNFKFNINRTGGGVLLPPLSHIEIRLMCIIVLTIVEGDATSELSFVSILNWTEYLLGLYIFS